MFLLILARLYYHQQIVTQHTTNQREIQRIQRMQPQQELLRIQRMQTQRDLLRIQRMHQQQLQKKSYNATVAHLRQIATLLNSPPQPPLSPTIPNHPTTSHQPPINYHYHVIPHLCSPHK